MAPPTPLRLVVTALQHVHVTEHAQKSERRDLNESLGQLDWKRLDRYCYSVGNGSKVYYINRIVTERHAVCSKD